MAHDINKIILEHSNSTDRIEAIKNALLDLFSSGFDPNKFFDNDTNPFINIIEVIHTPYDMEIISILLAFGADPYLSDCRYKSALEYTIKKHMYEKSRKLVDESLHRFNSNSSNIAEKFILFCLESYSNDDRIWIREDLCYVIDYVSLGVNIDSLHINEKYYEICIKLDSLILFKRIMEYYNNNIYSIIRLVIKYRSTNCGRYLIESDIWKDITAIEFCFENYDDVSLLEKILPSNFRLSEKMIKILIVHYSLNKNTIKFLTKFENIFDNSIALQVLSELTYECCVNDNCEMIDRLLTFNSNLISGVEFYVRSYRYTNIGVYQIAMKHGYDPYQTGIMPSWKFHSRLSMSLTEKAHAMLHISQIACPVCTVFDKDEHSGRYHALYNSLKKHGV